MAPKAAKREQPPTEAEALNEKQFQNPTSALLAHGDVMEQPRSGATVTVACKLGVTSYQIQLNEIVDKFEQNMQGGRTVKEATRIGNIVRLRGTAYPRGTPPVGFPERPEIINGAALTHGVDKDWFDEWLVQNKLNPIVINKMVFAHETMDGVRGESADLSKFLSGLEPIDPARDHRITKSSRSEVTDVQPGTKAAAG